MSGSISLGTIFGTNVRMHLTFPLLLVWVAAMETATQGARAGAVGVVFVMLLFVCVVAHEFGHILVASHFGGRTRDILLLPIGGVSRMERMPEVPSQELAVALAGPAVSIGIGFLLVAIAGSPTAESIQSADVTALLPRLAAANLFLALFNLLPAFPMDGGRALRAVLSMKVGRLRATQLSAYLGHVFGVLFGMFGLISGNPIILLIGVFVYFGASAEVAGTEMRERVRWLKVSDVMRTNFAVLEPNSPLSEAVTVMLHEGQHVIPIRGSGKIVGIVTKDSVIRALDQHGRDSRLASAMEANVPLVTANQKLQDAIILMQERSAPALLVVDPRGDPAGIISIETLADLMLVKALPEHLPSRAKDPRLTVSVPRAT